MSDTVISVENLSKRYLIGHESAQRESYTALRDVIAREMRTFARKAVDLYRGRQIVQGDETEEIWALRDVSFEVKRGEVLGIIGRNGAGKSTLLKVLSRITEPSEGRVRLRGRVGTLLEVGTGFHPELSGRENIYLNGAILGMTHAEICRKFDEIVAFAEVEKFLDTPVKRYSSGMYVRLAFAVAAHLEPDILLVDEVLAVGDGRFQQKCLGMLRDATRMEGRAVIFVSHNMAAVESLCQQCIWLQYGEIAGIGAVNEIIGAYLDATEMIAQNIPLKERRDRSGNGRVRAVSFSVADATGKPIKTLKSGGDYTFTIGCENFGKKIDDVVVSLDLYDEKERCVLLFRSSFTKEKLELGTTGNISCTVRNLPIVNGIYTCSIFLSYADAETLDHIEHAAQLIVEGGDFFGTGSMGIPSHCKVLTAAHWSSGVGKASGDHHLCGPELSYIGK
jgi:homopolymeric O-antigen transport system ATP-binding protein